MNDWYSLFSNQAKKERNAHSTKTNQTTSKPKKRNNRKRTGAKYSSRSVRSGYIDLEVSHKQEGTKRRRPHKPGCNKKQKINGHN